MAEKAPKRKAKPKREPQSVLGTLPASRPERLGRPRAAEVSRARQARPDTAGSPPAKRAVTKRVATKPAATGPKRAAAKRGATAAKPAATVPKRGTTVRPTAVRPAAPPLRRTHAAAPPPPKPLGAPRGPELVSTTIRAAGELAQIGLTVGGQVLKRTLDRIPRP